MILSPIVLIIALFYWALHKEAKRAIWWNDTYPDTPPPGWLEPGVRIKSAARDGWADSRYDEEHEAPPFG
jgi:hypothetical protein